MAQASDEVSGSEALAAGCDVAKYSETTRSAKAQIPRIHGLCPKVAADTNEDAGDVSPGSTVICRPGNATGSGYENVTD